MSADVRALLGSGRYPSPAGTDPSARARGASGAGLPDGRVELQADLAVLLSQAPDVNARVREHLRAVV